MLMVIIAYGVIFIETVVHELGHLLLAIVVGFRFHFFMVGPVTLFKRNGKLLVVFERVSGASGAGAAGFIPHGTDNLSKRVRLVAVGGPLASALMSLIGLLLVLQSTGGFGSFIAGMVATYPLVSIAFNLPPYTTDGTVSDGAIAFATPGGQHIIDSNAVTAQSATGLRPRGWDTRLVDVLLGEARRPETQCLGHLFAYYQALDHDDEQSAREHISQALELRAETGGLLETQVLFEGAYFVAQFLTDKEQAREYFDEAREDATLVERGLLYRAQAAVLLAEGFLEASRNAQLRAIEALEHPLDRGLATAEKDWLDALS